MVRDDKPFLAEPPLFTTFKGVEFPAHDRPTCMISGRASFKLAISLLSSKCDNRLFCICFIPQAPQDASLVCQPCYSKPIRSISRKRTQVTSMSMGPSLNGNNEGSSAVVSPSSMLRTTGNLEYSHQNQPPQHQVVTMRQPPLQEESNNFRTRPDQVPSPACTICLPIPRGRTKELKGKDILH